MGESGRALDTVVALRKYGEGNLLDLFCISQLHVFFSTKQKIITCVVLCWQALWFLLFRLAQIKVGNISVR